MHYLCLCHFDAAAFANLTAQDFEEIGALCAPHDARLKASGKVAMVGSLAMNSQVIRSTGSGSRVEPGPFEVSAQPVGAFFVVEAADDAEALEIAQMHPGAHLGDRFGGGIEIIPIDHLDQL
ncbi:YciI family protein [Sphingopyxis sp.]|jgi:hypothetical protein|uniref:YciI family protein n=1 Tax=Sphingopyxis sp. TaxID=1908224 RepID=UPI003F6F8B03